MAVTIKDVAREARVSVASVSRALNGHSSMYVRFDALNIFNYHNYSDYITNWGANGVLNQYPVSYNSIGNITGVPRTFKLTAGFRF